MISFPLVLGLACSSPDVPTPTPEAQPSRLSEALGMEVLTRAPMVATEGQEIPYTGYSVRPVRIQVFEDFHVSGVLWLPKGEGPHPTAIIAHGHFNEGKSSGESQGPAHALASRGWAALAMDTPGVEEGDLPGRQIHLAEGAHGRALLAAAGTSAMALQLHVLQAGLDYLESRGDLEIVAATGASGGAVQAFYLLGIDPRPKVGVFASFVPLPREARAGGCPCDALPGWAGPDPAIYSDLSQPTLWLSELVQERPQGLPPSAAFEVIESAHGFEAPMLARALDWLDQQVGQRGGASVPDPLPHTPSTSLASTSLGAATLFDLVAEAGSPAWRPQPRPSIPYVLDCAGEGAMVLAAGATPTEIEALVSAGLKACRIEVTQDETALAEAIVTQDPLANRFAGALKIAAEQHGAEGIYAVGAWGVAAAGSGVPYVLRDPISRAQDVSWDSDPTWIHVPGIWWGHDPTESALLRGDGMDALISALSTAVGH